MRKRAAVEMFRYRGKVGVPVEMRARRGMTVKGLRARISSEALALQ